MFVYLSLCIILQILFLPVDNFKLARYISYSSFYIKIQIRYYYMYSSVQQCNVLIAQLKYKCPRRKKGPHRAEQRFFSPNRGVLGAASPGAKDNRFGPKEL